MNRIGHGSVFVESHAAIEWLLKVAEGIVGVSATGRAVGEVRL